MRPFTYFFLFLSIAALWAGAFLASPADASPSGGSINTFLSELHLHGPLSEGRASMRHHSIYGDQAGYDVLWWTDHMERVASAAYPQLHTFPEDSLDAPHPQIPLSFIQVGNVVVATVPAAADYFGRFTHQGTYSVWTTGGLAYSATGQLERVSLMASPTVELDLRLTSPLPPDASLVVRFTLSSRGNGLDKIGIPNVIEYVPANMPFPTPLLNTDTLQLHTAQNVDMNGWTRLTLQPWQDVSPYFVEALDMSIHDIEILISCRNGQNLTVDLDNFQLDVDPIKSNKALLVAAESLANSINYPFDRLTQHVGMEMAGPGVQEITQYSTRDHVIALYPDPIGLAITEIYDYLTDPPGTFNWPKQGIEDVHADGGVAILAHIFSATAPPNLLDPPTIESLATRVIEKSAWGADGIEIGYRTRGADLAQFLQVWDALADMDVFITGVGVSDNHNVEDWDVRVNHMGTWIQAQTDSSTNLAAAIKSGHAFFGDPFVFSPDGTMEFQETLGAYAMGDVVVTTANPQTLTVDIQGAIAGAELVWFANGVEVQRDPFLADGTIQATATYDPNPGDWVRVEVHDSIDEAFLFSNPIYFVATAGEVPPHRAP